MKKPVFTQKIAGFDITLWQGWRGFTVSYGSQTKSNMKYEDAAKELGQCIFHALACEGKITNTL